MRTTISVSVTGDELLRKAISAVAADRGVTQGDIVRLALDRAFGNEIEQKRARLLANSGSKNIHVEANKTDEVNITSEDEYDRPIA